MPAGPAGHSRAAARRKLRLAVPEAGVGAVPRPLPSAAPGHGQPAGTAESRRTSPDGSGRFWTAPDVAGQCRRGPGLNGRTTAPGGCSRSYDGPRLAVCAPRGGGVVVTAVREGCRSLTGGGPGGIWGGSPWTCGRTCSARAPPPRPAWSPGRWGGSAGSYWLRRLRSRGPTPPHSGMPGAGSGGRPWRAASSARRRARPARWVSSPR